MFKKNNIRRRIFSAYAQVFIVLCVIAFFGINSYVGHIQRRNAEENLHNLAYSLSEQLDSLNEIIYNFAVNVSSSNVLLTNFFSNVEDEVSLRRIEAAITDQVLSIFGPMYPLHRIVLRRADGLIYEYSSREINLMTVPDGKYEQMNFDKALVGEGMPCFSCSFTDRNAEFLEDVPVIAVCLSFPEWYGDHYTNTVEVQEKYDSYRRVVEEHLSSNTGRKDYQVYVFDTEGRIVFPYSHNDGSTDESGQYWSQQKKDPLYYTDQNGTRMMGCLHHSTLSGWTTLILRDERGIMASFYRFLVLSSLIVIGFLLIILIITYHISNSITVPLQGIIKRISEYNLNRENTAEYKKTEELDEMAALADTFDDMSHRIEAYVDEVTTLKLQDLESRYYALQSQMNPHFLYNSLSILSIMCEEGEREASVEFCEELAKMLRYSSSNTFQSVTLAEEMDYTETYLKLLQKRYENLLDTDVSMQPSLAVKEVPRMIVQPLVENAVKYGLSTQPPWFISVEAYESEEGWNITVSDTGTGFEEEILSKLRAGIKDIEEKKTIPELKIGGMGLLNIFTRLRLFFPAHVRFEIGNLREGGAFVKIIVLEE